MLKLEYLELENVYGYPALSPMFLKWAKAQSNIQVVISVHNLREVTRSKEFIVVVAGLPFLESSGIPILGYQRNANGVWTKSSLEISLQTNSVKVLLPKMHQEPASTKALYNFYVNNVMSDDFSSRFKTFHTRECLNDRVFQHKRKI